MVVRSNAAKARPRRRPARESGRAIVDAILSASALLLERDGIEGLTTNAISRVAGVSVGSLYQYFPDKHAIVAELARRLEATGRDFAIPQLDWMHDSDVRNAAWRIAGLVDDPALGSLELRRTLLREVPRGWIFEATKDVDATLETLLTGFLRTRAGEVRDAPPEELAFVIYHAIDGVVEGAILLEPSLLGSDALRSELFHLAWRFVAREGADLSPPPGARSALAAAPPASEDGALRARFEREPTQRRTIAPRAASPTSRGKATREAIREATARLLAAEGLAALSVRKIAREAGVASGALYHHFANIESIVAELGLEQELRMRATMAEGVSLVEAQDRRRAIEGLVRMYAAPDEQQRARRRAILREVPRRWAEHASMQTGRVARRRLAAELDARGAAVRGGDHELMAFVACRAVEGVVEAALVREPSWADPDRLVDELAELVFRYVRAA